MAEPRYAVIGESEGVPILSHMNQTAALAEQLRVRREAAVGQPCFIVPMAAWLSDPRGALREALRGAPVHAMTSKYDGLADHLGALGAATIILTFAEIEAIVDPLPETARCSVEWWGVTVSGRDNNAHALGWWHAGYVADRPDFAAHTVTFRRLAR